MILSIFLALRVASAWGQEPDERKNVLLIIADDFRPNVGVLGSENSFSSVDMVTPNLDKLAARSLVLTNAYTQVSVTCQVSGVMSCVCSGGALWPQQELLHDRPETRHHPVLRE